MCCVAFDTKPKRMYPQYYKKYPYMDNARLLCKHLIRADIYKELPKQIHYTYIHSVDNVEEAWHYINVTMPERISIIKKIIENRYPNCPKCGPRHFLNGVNGIKICKKCKKQYGYA